LIKKERPSAESSHTRWGLGKDYMRQVLPLQYNAERLHYLLAQVGLLYHCAKPVLHYLVREGCVHMTQSGQTLPRTFRKQELALVQQ
jgi:hypothetical protein